MSRKDRKRGKGRKAKPNLSHLADRETPEPGSENARLRARVRALEAALRPFARIELPTHSTGPACWIYAGQEGAQQEPPHFRVGDLIRARESVGLA